MNLQDTILSKYQLHLSEYDRELWKILTDKERAEITDQILEKYEMCANILSQLDTPQLRKTLARLLNVPAQQTVIPFSRLKDLIEYHQTGYLNEVWFNRLHKKLIHTLHLFKAFTSLIHDAKDQQFTPQEFQEYLNSGLFDQGIYVLRHHMTEEQRSNQLRRIEFDVYKDFAYELCEKDKEFILTNKLQNFHVAHQIVTPKYRLAYEIKVLLGNDFFNQVINEQLEEGLNIRVPILQRIKTLAEWVNEGYLSPLLMQKYYFELLHDLDELDEFISFLEVVAEHMNPFRTVHYLELGLYQISNSKQLDRILKQEHHLYDLSDELEVAVQEFTRIMNTPKDSGTSVTNGRVAECYRKLLRSIEVLKMNEDLGGERYAKKIWLCQIQLTKLLNETLLRNQILPTQKPYRALKLIREIGRIHFNIESETLLKISRILIREVHPKYKLTAQSHERSPFFDESWQQFLFRVHWVEHGLSRPKDQTAIIGKLLSLQHIPLFALSQFLNVPKQK